MTSFHSYLKMYFLYNDIFFRGRVRVWFRSSFVFGKQGRCSDNQTMREKQRVTIAVKVATAGMHQFDEIVWSNSEDIRTTIYTWARTLLAAAKRDKIQKALEDFKSKLKNKKFMRQSDSELVNELLERLVNRFASKWKEESERQKSMSSRARDVLLRWGEFSTKYVKKARLLRQENEESGWMWSLVKLVGLSVFGSLVVTLPLFSKQDECVDSVLYHTVVWLRVSIFRILSQPVMNYIYLRVPMGYHTLLILSTFLSMLWSCISSEPSLRKRNSTLVATYDDVVCSHQCSFRNDTIFLLRR